MHRYALRDDQWERIEGILPGHKDFVGVTARDNRLFVEAVLYRYRAGIPWRDLPERFGNFRVIYTRHTRWSKKGVWERIFELLAEDTDNEYKKKTQKIWVVIFSEGFMWVMQVASNRSLLSTGPKSMLEAVSAWYNPAFST